MKCVQLSCSFWIAIVCVLKHQGLKDLWLKNGDDAYSARSLWLLK